jgi:hypothetical protein
MNLFKTLVSLLLVLALVASFAPPPAAAGQDTLSRSSIVVTSAVTDQATSWLRMAGNYATATVEGTGTATVKLQRRSVTGETPSSDITEQTLADKGAYLIEDRSRCEYRVVVPSGGLASGSVTLILEVHP